MAATKPVAVTDDKALRARVDVLCSHAVFSRAELDYARHEPKLKVLVLPERLAELNSCEGDYGNLSKCSQEEISLKVALDFAPGLRCQVLTIETVETDGAKVTVRLTSPKEVTLSDGKLHASKETKTTDHLMFFRRTKDGWLFDPPPAEKR